MNAWTCWLLLWVSLVVADGIEIQRTWNKKDGNTTEAVYVSHDATRVTIKKGLRTYRVALEQLIEGDREWLESLTESGYPSIVVKEESHDPLDRGRANYQVKSVREGERNCDLTYRVNALGKGNKVLHEVVHELEIEPGTDLEGSLVEAEGVWEANGRLIKGKTKTKLGKAGWFKLAVQADPEAQLIALRIQVSDLSKIRNAPLLVIRDPDKLDIAALMKGARDRTWKAD